MKFLTLFALFCLLFLFASAKKKEKQSYWESALNEVYEHASEAKEKVVKVSSQAYEHVSKVVNSPEVATAASSAYATASSLGQKAVDASTAAFEQVKIVANSPEITQAASAAYESAASLGQKAVDASSAAFVSINEAIESGEAKAYATRVASDAYTTASELSQKAAKAIESGEAKTYAARAASDAYEGAVNVANGLGKSFAELKKGRQPKESWTGYLKRVAPQLVYEKEAVVVEGETSEGTATGSDDVVVENEKKEKKPWTEYIFFWRDLNGTSFKDSFTHFSQRFYYAEDEDEKRAANLGYSSAINQIAGVFRKINGRGKVPIYGLESGFGWGMRQINTAGKTAIYKPSLFGSTFSHFGSLFWYGSVVAETVNVVNAAAKDLDEGTSTNTVRASSKALGSWTGAAVGASAGATLLSPIPLVGPLVGGVVGGFTGAYAGEIAGEAAANAYAAGPKDTHKEL